MRSRRSISDIVAVVLLIVIAIAAAVIIYMWLSGLIGSVHTSTSATQVKLEITGASVTNITSTSPVIYDVNATVYNPPDSPSTSITQGELEFTNGTLLCSQYTTAMTSTTTTTVTTSTTVTPTTVTFTLIVKPSSIPPGSSATVYFNCLGPAAKPGTPVEVVLVTSQGVQVSYTTSIS